MARKVSKNQRTNRGAGVQSKKMVKIRYAYRKEGGGYGYNDMLVEESRVESELERIRNKG